jgi:D-alanyl-lipoteichoic acid acyltransferase DltB (MBOAT superfamily)
MTINSIEFLLFFCAVFFLYYFLLKEKTKGQNILLLLASVFFYGLANWKIMLVLVSATFSFYALGISIGRSHEDAPRRAAVLTALGVCLGVVLLLYCKYLNFFISSFSRVFSILGLHTNLGTFNILAPLGISFFTFKLISYVLEVYRQRIEPVTDIAAFGVYAVFFPTILAGPIDRPNTFIPQVQSKRPFDYLLAVEGCRQILWGMFKKMVIADNMALPVDTAWTRISEMPRLFLLIAVFCYSIQLYADFSGYSDMAV